MINFGEKNITDEELYEMCLSGDESAWEYLYNHVLQITWWPKWNLRDSQEDLAQSITLFLMDKGIHKVAVKASFRNFVTKVAINKIKDSFKSPIIMRKSIEDPITTQDGESLTAQYTLNDPSPEDVAMDKDLQSLIEKVLKRMPDHCSSVLREYFRYKLGYIEDYNELSTILNRPIGTISAQIKRCLNTFSKQKEIREYL